MDFTFAAQNLAQFEAEFEFLKSHLDFFPSNYCSAERLYHSFKYTSDGWSTQNISFTAALNGQPQFAFIGFIHSNKSQSKVSFFDLPAVFIESKSINRNNIKKILSYFFLQVSAADHIYLRDLMLHGYVSLFSEYLRESNDSISVEWSSRRIIDLSFSESCLKNAIRKSYRSLINKGSREFSPQIFNRMNISHGFIEEFRQLHIRESGRETRPLSTWLQQLQAVKEGFAFCIGSYLNGNLISAGYFITSDSHCYYGVSASRRDMFDKPVFHSLLWTAILYCKTHGLSFFEIDTNALSFSSVCHLTSKEAGIRTFKSGFGGKIFPSLTICGAINK